MELEETKNDTKNERDVKENKGKRREGIGKGRGRGVGRCCIVIDPPTPLSFPAQAAETSPLPPSMLPFFFRLRPH